MYYFSSKICIRITTNFFQDERADTGSGGELLPSGNLGTREDGETRPVIGTTNIASSPSGDTVTPSPQNPLSDLPRLISTPPQSGREIIIENLILMRNTSFMPFFPCIYHWV